MINKIPISKPFIDDEEIEGVVNVLKSGMIAQGDVVREFEEKFSGYIGSDFAVAVSNGTVALDVALKAWGIGEGDEVITTPFTFIATSNSILFQKAKPVFADIEADTYNINPDDVLEKISPKTKAIIGVHLFGHPFDVKAIMDICEDHDLILIEDSAQAHGAEFRGKKVGSFGTGCFSFYATKNITTGEGGMITTSDKKIAEKCRLLRSHGEASKYNHLLLGYNFRMTNIQAAIGLAQLEKLDRLNEMRRRNAEFLNRNIKVEGLVKPVEMKGMKHVYHQYVVRVEEEFPMKRDEFAEFLTSKGIGNAVHYPAPIYKQPLYIKLGFGDVRCPVAEEVSSRVLSLPVHPGVGEEQLRYIAETINSVS
ncbi:DegT/DnrJ/EryC1/StrS family aminotransferase [Archaeoglobus neptunius]|uniref:DegT/DnrJ/EryC1/StrS family aminotransferase n=1 Tax=Archaeoglobus neptunius TaxID=2798580 RepID=UPI0019264910|nr:DegT/DnrJ/EryC1/StrS family aminotransferase [Archaeoglobus neptunius]